MQKRSHKKKRCQICNLQRLHDRRRSKLLLLLLLTRKTNTWLMIIMSRSKSSSNSKQRLRARNLKVMYNKKKRRRSLFHKYQSLNNQLKSWLNKKLLISLEVFIHNSNKFRFQFRIM